MIHKAIEFATIKHDGQYRKGSKTPYIMHPMEVMYILTSNGCSENVIVAGILHDTLEDTSATSQELICNFGENVTQLVIYETEDKSKSWYERKQATIDLLQGDNDEIKLVRCADMLSNIRSLRDSINVEGEKTWTHFNAGKKETMWYYKSVIDAISCLEKYPMYQELCHLFNIVFD